MLRFAATRLVSLGLSLIAASLVIFAVIEVVPGDPAAFMLGLNAEPEAVAALRDELGLNGSRAARYLSWVGGMVTGDFGQSYTYRVPVSQLVLQRLWVSLPLALYALGLSTLIAFPIGLIAASRRGRPADYGIMAATQLGVAVPNFWFAMLLVLVFAVNLRWFSAGGFPGWEAGAFAALKALTLPAVSLALPQASILARVMRSALIETLGQDYIRTARAKGLSRRQAITRHALRNALIPVLTVLGLEMGTLIGGTVLVEFVFNWPGLSGYLVAAVDARDYPEVVGIVMTISVLFVFLNLVVDVVNALLDPRISLVR